MLKILFVFLFSLNIFSAVVPDKDAQGNIVQKNDPFYSKSNYFFRGTGKVFTISSNSTLNMEYTVLYPHVKFNGIHIINSEIGDKANLKIVDTPTGAYTLAQTGTAVPNAVLNQFGFDWNLSNSQKEIIPYASDLYQGMRIVVEYINNQASSKDIYINYYIHEE